MTVEMTPQYWQAARAIAQELPANQDDALQQTVDYLCWLRNRDGTVEDNRLFTYLATLTRSGEIRSNQTPLYYKALEQACLTHLKPLQLEGDALIYILGWAARLHNAR